MESIRPGFYGPWLVPVFSIYFFWFEICGKKTKNAPKHSGEPWGWKRKPWVPGSVRLYPKDSRASRLKDGSLRLSKNHGPWYDMDSFLKNSVLTSITYNWCLVMSKWAAWMASFPTKWWAKGRNWLGGNHQKWAILLDYICYMGDWCEDKEIAD